MINMTTPPKGFSPTFENHGFWEYYRDLERQFEEFLVYVPYLEGNEGTYSFRLANLIVSIGAHIDSAFKEIARYPPYETKYPLILKNAKRKPKKATTIWDYFPLAEELNLSQQKVTFKRLPVREELYPFNQYQKTKNAADECITCPDWWNVYNSIKHNFKENFKEAKLTFVKDALAGAFLLNVVHKPASVELFKYGLLKPKYLPVVMWEEIYDNLEDLNNISNVQDGNQ
jgi:hypothetical protein